MRIIALILLLVTSASPRAETLPGSIEGRCVDRVSQRPIPNANVKILGLESGTSTDHDGRFVFDRVKEDVYKLAFSHVGFHPFVETDVRVIRGKVTDIEDIELIPSVIKGDEVVVSAGLFDDDPSAPVSNTVYQREQIKRTPGSAGDILRAIEALPGVSTSGGEFSAFSVRGGSPKDNIILVDNIPFDKVTHFNGGSEEQDKLGGRFSIFTPGLIEEAAGGFSPLYGGKFSSLLEMNIREGNPRTPTANVRYDLLGWETNYDGPIGLHKKTSLVFSARHQDFTRILELTGQEEFGSPRFTDLILKTTTELSERHKVSFLSIYAPEKYDRTTQDVFESEDFAQSDLTDLDEQKLLVGLSWRALIGSSGFAKSSVYLRRTNRNVAAGRAWPKFADPGSVKSDTDISSKQTLTEHIDELEIGLRSLYVYAPSNTLSWTAGFELSRTRFDLDRRQNGVDTLFVYDQTDFRSDLSQRFLVRRPESVNRRFNETKTLGASFTSLSLTPASLLTLNVGLRHEYNEFNRRHHVAPRMSATLRMNPNTRLNLATGVYYQTPQFEDLTAAPPNLDLKNERAIHLIAGVTRYLNTELKLTAEAYYQSFDDLVVRNDRTTSLRTNAGDGYSTGVDLSLIHRFARKFFGQVNYSWARSRRDDHNGEGAYDSDFNQPHIFSALGGYEFNKTVSIAGKWRYATGRPKDSFIVHRDIFNDPNFVRYSKEITTNNTDRLSPFHTLNFRLDSRYQIGRFAIVSFLDIVNVYAHLNVNEDRFLEITGEEDRRGFRILPSGGVKLEI